jgi:hypothetical protein
MNKIFYLTAVSAILFFAACGDSANPEEGNTEVSIPAGWAKLDLGEQNTHYSLNMLINIPDENTSRGTPELMEGPFGGMQVKIGSGFNLEIIPGGQTLAEKKEEIESNPVFKISYLVNEEEGFIYKSEIEGADVVQYNFYLLRKIGNGLYGIENLKEDEYSEDAVRRMYESAKSLRPKA